VGPVGDGPRSSQAGHGRATLDEIALEAGLTKGAVYSNFASKADLFLAVVDARAQERAPRLSRARERATSLEDLARRHARAAIADDRDGRWASVLVEAWAAAGDDEQFRAALPERNRAVNAQIGRHIEEIATRSGMEFPYPADTLAQSCGGMLRGLLLQRLLGAVPQARTLGIGAPTPLHITNRAFAELRGGRSDTPRLSVLTPLAEVVAALNEYQPENIFTYPSYIRRLAEEQDAGRLAIGPARFVSTAEVLTEHVRLLAGQTWGAQVLNGYGTTEAGMLGTECDLAAGVHIV
jgi:AcrR family transcriptional regulator